MPKKFCRLLPAKNVWVYYSLLKSYFRQILKKSWRLDASLQLFSKYFWVHCSFNERCTQTNLEKSWRHTLLKSALVLTELTLLPWVVASGGSLLNFSPNIFGCTTRWMSDTPKIFGKKLKTSVWSSTCLQISHDKLIITPKSPSIEEVLSSTVSVPEKHCRLLPAKNVWVYYSFVVIIH